MLSGKHYQSEHHLQGANFERPLISSHDYGYMGFFLSLLKVTKATRPVCCQPNAQKQTFLSGKRNVHSLIHSVMHFFHQKGMLDKPRQQSWVQSTSLLLRHARQSQKAQLGTFIHASSELHVKQAE